MNHMANFEARLIVTVSENDSKGNSFFFFVRKRLTDK